MKIETVKLRDFEMDFFKFGNPENPKIVVIPGVSLKSVMPSADFIKAAFKKLSDNYEVYVIDRRKNFPTANSLNSFNSDSADSSYLSYTVHEMAKDTAEVLKKLNLKNVNLVGVSQGGMISQYIAIENPQLVNKLVLVSTACSIEPDAKKIFNDWINLSDKKSVNELAESFGKAVYTPDFYNKYKDVILSACNGTDEEFKKFSASVRGMDGFDLQPELSKIKCPAIVFAGQDDKIFSHESSRKMANKLSCKLQVFKNYGHALYDESPEYIDRLLEFFATN